VPYVPPVSPGSSDYVTAEAGGFRSRYPLQVMGKEIVVETPLVGRHQLRNVALAISAAEELGRQGFGITAEAVERGVRETRWPGRFEVVRAAGEYPEIVFDAAHNPAGAWALRSSLSSVYGDRRMTIVFGAMRDKAIGEIAEILFPAAHRVILTLADNPRSASPEEIRAAASRVAVEMEDTGDVGHALEHARTVTGPDEIVVITGSIYVVGEAMRILGVRI
jgi:dihydrofolate synthase/folylpolyglutamate synthase